MWTTGNYSFWFLPKDVFYSVYIALSSLHLEFNFGVQYYLSEKPVILTKVWQPSVVLCSVQNVFLTFSITVKLQWSVLILRGKARLPYYVPGSERGPGILIISWKNFCKYFLFALFFFPEGWCFFFTIVVIVVFCLFCFYFFPSFPIRFHEPPVLPHHTLGSQLARSPATFLCNFIDT